MRYGLTLVCSFVLVVSLGLTVRGEAIAASNNGSADGTLHTPPAPFVVALSLDTPAADPDAGPPNYHPEFSLGVGYSRLELKDASGPVDSEDAIRFDPRIAFSPIPRVPQFRIGLSLGLTFGWDNLGNGAVIVDNGQLIVISGDHTQSLSLFEPELEASWRFGWGRDFYIEPGVAGGAMVGFYRISHDYLSGSSDYDDWAGAFQGRAFVRAGYAFPEGYGGLEASYLRSSKLDFADNTKGEVEEFYIGVFGSIEF